MTNFFTNIKGIYSSAINCGIKEGKLDLTYIYIPDCYASAGVFTKNKFAADCVYFNKENIKANNLKAFVINSGNANAVTKNGRLANNEIANFVAKKLNIKKEEVGIASTGIIGKELPYENILSGLNSLLDNPAKHDGELSSKAIMTTDLVPKSVYLEKDIAGKKVIVSGIAKGSGMISPNMATMLGFVFTNVKIPKALLQEMLSVITDETYNMVSVDTDTSTNDMVLAFATDEIELDFSNQTTKDEFKNLFKEVNLCLAKKIARDGEGATKLIEVEVLGAETFDDARKIAKSVVDSPLVKTAIHGADANWGRIIMAIGKVDNTNVEVAKVNLQLQGVQILKNGFPVEFNKLEVTNKLKEENIFIKINLSLGEFSSKAWGCDLSHKYIDINVDYN